MNFGASEARACQSLVWNPEDDKSRRGQNVGTCSLSAEGNYRYFGHKVILCRCAFDLSFHLLPSVLNKSGCSFLVNCRRARLAQTHSILAVSLRTRRRTLGSSCWRLAPVLEAEKAQSHIKTSLRTCEISHLLIVWQFVKFACPPRYRLSLASLQPQQRGGVSLR